MKAVPEAGLESSERERGVGPRILLLLMASVTVLSGVGEEGWNALASVQISHHREDSP